MIQYGSHKQRWLSFSKKMYRPYHGIYRTFLKKENYRRAKAICVFLQIANSDKLIALYSLDVIISVGYRVKSLRGTQFRIWTNSILKKYITKGFALDDNRLKDGGGRYFKELIQRVRDIRNLYQQITDIYATAIDYDPKADITHKFFATVQNKMHYAVHKHTAAEIIYDRVDVKKTYVGMTSFKGNYVTKQDVGVAKNYLSEKELQIMQLIVSQFLDYAELQALEEKPITMQDWIDRLDYQLQSIGSPY